VTKTKTLLLILCALIVLTAGYASWWMLFQADFQMEAPLRSGDEITGYTSLSPEHAALANIARYGSVLLPLLGIYLLLINILAKKGAYGGSQRLAAFSNIAAGAVTAGLSFLATVWGYPLTFYSSSGGTLNQGMVINISPGPDEVWAMYATAGLLIFALATAAVGIAQLVRLKKAQSV
jgi:hypothetical protein